MPPIDPAHLLAGAEAACSRPTESAAVIARALQAAPDDPGVRLAAYRFYFYTHDHGAALEQARAVLGHAARRLNLAPDWAEVRARDAAFTAHEAAPGLYLQALIAVGYCAARTGAMETARAALAKAAELDPTDRFGGAWLLARLDRADDD
ncbi:hypothetical protein [Actibacterium sp. D379-3]